MIVGGSVAEKKAGSTLSSQCRWYGVCSLQSGIIIPLITVFGRAILTTGKKVGSGNETSVLYTRQRTVVMIAVVSSFEFIVEAHLIKNGFPCKR